MTTLEARQDTNTRLDQGILADITEALWGQPQIRALDLHSFSVSVKNGTVLLRGHLTVDGNRQLIERIAGSVPGVMAVDNRLVVDRDLAMQVALALASDECTRHLVLPVGCSHGWVRLGGHVPDRETQCAAEDVAGRVPAVRGIVSLPAVAGESPAPDRRAVQPQIGSIVHGDTGQEGVVTRVVITPRNRLVTHAVVRVYQPKDGTVEINDYLVPVDAMQQVNEESIFLKRNGPRLTGFRTFDPSGYPLSPADWQPPYPYLEGSVHWRSGA